MQTPGADEQSRGNSMATDSASPNTKRDGVDTETSSTQLQSPIPVGEEDEVPKRAAIPEQSHKGNNLYGPQVLPVAGEVEQTALKAADIAQSSAQYRGTARNLTLTINQKTSKTTLSAGSQPNKATNPSPSDLRLHLEHLEPPVTRATLAELDVAKIIYNSKLRHDVNFDPDLHYRPNFDGEKGRRKNQKAIEFWNALQSQIPQFLADPETFQAKHGVLTWTLPATLKAIGEILMTLVPPEDRSTVEEALNVELLMQQFSKGVADLEQLALWFSRTLRAHCAPMRDVWVDEMVVQLTNGNRNGDIAVLVQGLQMLLGIVEAMRLDVANHQIRCLRPLLIQDTVEFEQTFFLKRIAQGHIDICASYAWFESYRNRNMIPSFSQEGDVWIFFRGFVDLLRLSNANGVEGVPGTLEFDLERIVKLRSDLVDAVNLEVCMALFDSLMTGAASLSSASSSAPSTPTINSADTPSSRNSLVGSPLIDRLSSPTLPSPRDFSRPAKTNLARDAGHFTRSPLGDSVTWVSAPENSRVTASLSMQSHASGSLIRGLSTSSHQRDQMKVEPCLRSALFAILDDHSGFPRNRSCSHPSSAPLSCDRWYNAAPALALEILRTTSLELSELSRVEKELTGQLSNPASEAFQTCETVVLARLGHLIERNINAWEHLSSYDLFLAAAKGPKSRSLGNRDRAEHGRMLEKNRNMLLENIARIVAHVGILHWKIWGEIAYAVDPNEEIYSELKPELNGKGKYSAELEPHSQSMPQTPQHEGPGLVEEIGRTSENGANSNNATTSVQGTAENGSSKSDETPKSDKSLRATPQRQNSACAEEIENKMKEGVKRDY